MARDENFIYNVFYFNMSHICGGYDLGSTCRVLNYVEVFKAKTYILSRNYASQPCVIMIMIATTSIHLLPYVIWNVWWQDNMVYYNFPLSGWLAHATEITMLVLLNIPPVLKKNYSPYLIHIKNNKNNSFPGRISNFGPIMHIIRLLHS